MDECDKSHRLYYLNQGILISIYTFAESEMLIIFA